MAAGGAGDQVEAGEGQVGGEFSRLRHIADRRIAAAGRLTEDRDAAGRRRHEAEHRTQQRGLAGTIGAENADKTLCGMAKLTSLSTWRPPKPRLTWSKFRAGSIFGASGFVPAESLAGTFRRRICNFITFIVKMAPSHDFPSSIPSWHGFADKKGEGDAPV